MAEAHRSIGIETAGDTDAGAGDRARRVFLSTLSHEIRTPLNGVLGMAQAMAADTLSDTQRDRLEILRQSAETLLLILNDLVGVPIAERAPAQAPAPTPATERPLRVLAAEDNPVNQVVLRALLEQ